MKRLFSLIFMLKALYIVPGGQPIGLLFELIMGSKGGGFGIVSHSFSGSPVIRDLFLYFSGW